MKTPSSLLQRAFHARNEGFTLLEIMLVVGIIALLLAAVAYSLTGIFGGAQKDRIAADFSTLSNALDMYKMRCFSYPSTAEGLSALVNAPPSASPRWTQSIKTLPLDPWNEPYIYKFPGTHNAGKFDIYSKGEDRTEGTADDVGNW